LVKFLVAFLPLEIASGIALAMTEPPGDSEEVGRWQGADAALPSANLVPIKMNGCHCDPDEARGREKQSLKNIHNFKLKPDFTKCF
jgi:hypothetical protein